MRIIVRRQLFRSKAMTKHFKHRKFHFLTLAYSLKILKYSFRLLGVTQILSHTTHPKCDIFSNSMTDSGISRGTTATSVYCSRDRSS